MKKYTKLLSILLICLIFVINIYNISNANDYGMKLAQQSSGASSGYSSEIKSLIDKDYKDTTNVSGNIQNAATPIIVVVKIIGITVAIVILLVLAMKYMIASPGEKADIKKSAIPYVIGAIIIFGAVGLLDIISKFSEVFK